MNKSMIAGIVPARKHLKLALLSLVALSALVFLAACGGGTTGTGGTTPTAGTTPTTGVTATTAPTATPTATATQAGNTQTVVITDGGGSFAFSPASLTIKVGTTVTWQNNTQAPHTVTSDDGKSFDSGSSNPIASGGSFSFTFKTAGTFAYHCAIHPFMKATIIVQ